MHTSASIPARSVLRLALGLFISLAMFAGLVGSAADVDARQDPERDRVDAAFDGTNDRIEELRLKCRPRIVHGERGVRCRWSASNNDNVRAYQVYRIVNGSPRELVATIPADGRRVSFDADVQRGDRLVYGVVARNAAGRVLAVGGPERLGIPHD